LAGVKVFLKDNLRSMVCDALAAHKIEREQFFSESIIEDQVTGDQQETYDLIQEFPR